MAIPASAAPFFQEYDFASLNPEEHAGLIMERILAYGNRSELRWLVQTYSWDGVRGWVAQSGSRRLPWRRYHLWCIVFELPVEDRPAGRIWPH